MQEEDHWYLTRASRDILFILYKRIPCWHWFCINLGKFKYLCRLLQSYCIKALRKTTGELDWQTQFLVLKRKKIIRLLLKSTKSNIYLPTEWNMINNILRYYWDKFIKYIVFTSIKYIVHKSLCYKNIVYIVIITETCWFKHFFLYVF